MSFSELRYKCKVLYDNKGIIEFSFLCNGMQVCIPSMYTNVYANVYTKYVYKCVALTRQYLYHTLLEDIRLLQVATHSEPKPPTVKVMPLQLVLTNRHHYPRFTRSSLTELSTRRFPKDFELYHYSNSNSNKGYNTYLFVLPVRCCDGTFWIVGIQARLLLVSTGHSSLQENTRNKVQGHRNDLDITKTSLDDKEPSGTVLPCA